MRRSGSPAEAIPTPTFPELFVVGAPYPKGSMQPGVSRTGKPYARHDNDFDLQRWTGKVRQAVVEAWGLPRYPGAVAVTLAFFLPKPTREYRDKDLDKLERAILDVLTGTAFVDDKQVRLLIGSKDFVSLTNTRPGVRINLAALEQSSDIVRSFTQGG